MNGRRSAFLVFSPCPFRLVAELAQHLSDPGISERLRHPGSRQAFQPQFLDGYSDVPVDQRAGQLVREILPACGKTGVDTVQPGHGAAAVHTALALPCLASFQAAQPLRLFRRQPGRSIFGPVLSAIRLFNPASTPTAGSDGLGIGWRGSFNLHRHIPAIRAIAGLWPV